MIPPAAEVLTAASDTPAEQMIHRIENLRAMCNDSKAEWTAADFAVIQLALDAFSEELAGRIEAEEEDE